MHYLSTEYVHFTFDASVRTVTFENTLVPISFAGVHGLVKIKGQWKTPDDWTSTSAKTWCRDADTEDLEELIVVFTNKEWQDTMKVVDPGAHRPTVKAYPTGCVGWAGTDSMSQTITSPDPRLTIEESIVSTIRFGVDSSLMLAGQPVEYWKSVGGSISWQVTVSGACSGTAQGSLAIPELNDDHVASLQISSENGRLRHSGSNGPWPGRIPAYKVNCANGQTAELVLYGALGFFGTEGELSRDGKSFSGNSVSHPSPAHTVRHRYSFRCATGC
jgi:hypothetical protein